MGRRWRSREEESDTEGEGEAAKEVVFLSSSEDEEANEDLSLAIVSKARFREAKRKRAEDKDRAQTFFVDLSTSSADEIEAVPNGNGAGARKELGPAGAGEEMKKKRKKRPPRKKKKKKAEKESGLELPDAPAKAEEATETADFLIEVVNEASGNIVLRKHPEPPDAPDKEDELTGAVDSVIEVVNEASSNVVLRKLLRGPRYFDPGHGIWESCFNCGDEGHIASNCKVEKRQRPCFVCGMFGHYAKHCVLGQDCFICKRRGHQAKDCPDKQKNAQGSVICLRCGDLGHDMESCSNNYAPCDLQEIQCYICKKYGHLCCVDYLGNGPRVVSCYNCAQTGHTGQGCAKQWGENAAAAAPPALCYRCGQEGHFARGCTKSPKSARHIGESSAHIRRLKDKKDSHGSKSVPRDFGKVHKKKSPYFEKSTKAAKSKLKGGWIVDDDPGYLPKMKLKSNGWESPSTPSSRSYKNYSAASANRYSSPFTQSYSSPHTQSYSSPRSPQSYSSQHTPQSYSSQYTQKRYNYYLGTPNSRGSTGGYYHGYPASRFGNPQQGYYG